MRGFCAATGGMPEADAVKYRLGLDLGTNSIGWAAIKLDDGGEPCGILDMGARVFPDGRNPKDESSLAVQRRVPRGMRRRRDRYLRRREDLMEDLVSFGLMPPDEEAQKEVEKLNTYVLRANALDAQLKPYELGRVLFHLNQRRGFKSNRKENAKADKEKKTNLEKISALRRQMSETKARTLGEFLAHRYAQGEAVRARAETGLYADRFMYEAEFEKIRLAQAERQHLRPEQWDHLHETIFHQRPLKPVEAGLCLLEEGEKRAARALPIAQEFRMTQEVANLRLRDGFEPERALNATEHENALKRLRAGKDIDLQKPTRDLGLPDEAEFNLSRGGRKKIKRDEATTVLSKDDCFGKRWFEMSPGQRDTVVQTLLANDDPAAVKKIARESWGLDEKAAENVAAVDLPPGYVKLSVKAIEKILPFMADEGLVYSDAVERAGYTHHSDFRSGAAHDRLPYYGEALPLEVIGGGATDPKADDPARFGRIPNPTVHIGMGQLRRVLNRLIEVYGKPETITVELARQLKMNREEKVELERRQREGEARNEAFKKNLEAAGRQWTPETLRKLRLWKEQGPEQGLFCPYSGKVIRFEMVVSEQTEIDHILPFSKTWDDSPSNQVVCLRQANRDKGDRSPFEAFSSNPPGYDYEAIKERAKQLPQNKRWRFMPDAMERFKDQAEFQDRQLNETQWLSRLARKYLAYLYDEKGEGRLRVRASNGRLTALLRRGWGLNGILDNHSLSGERTPAHGGGAPQNSPLPAGEGEGEGEDSRTDNTQGKRRDDHRHHAVDAFVIALTSRGLVQKISKAAEHLPEEELRALANKDQLKPWPGYRREELLPFVNRIVVSHKPDHGTPGVKGKTTGQLHEETAFGVIKVQDQNGKNAGATLVQAEVVTSKKLDKFKKKEDLGAVRDPKMREVLMALWDSAAGKPAEFQQKAWTAGVKLGARTFKVRSVRVTEDARVVPVRDSAGNVYKAYKPGGNEFADIWEMPDATQLAPAPGKRRRRLKPGEREWRMEVVSTFEANQPGFNAANRRPHPGAKHIARLHINDMCAFGAGFDRKIVRVVKTGIEGGREFVYFVGHREANADTRVRSNELKYLKKSAEALRKEGFRKVGVDEIGRVRDPGPRSGGSFAAH